MQKALPPYRTWPPSPASSAVDGGGNGVSASSSARPNVAKLVAENAVIAFGRPGCCMCHVVKQLLLGLGVNPTIYFVEEEDETAVIDELSRIGGSGADGIGKKLQFPVIFVGGKLFGGLERVMATHITGELVPLLREAKALWL